MWLLVVDVLPFAVVVENRAAYFVECRRSIVLRLWIAFVDILGPLPMMNMWRGVHPVVDIHLVEWMNCLGTLPPVMSQFDD